jgi:hypothetical protein
MQVWKIPELPFSNDIGCIVQDTVNIKIYNLRVKANRHVKKLLLQKVHARFMFPADPIDKQTKIVNNRAIHKCSRALSNGRSMLRTKVEDKAYFE